MPAWHALCDKWSQEGYAALTPDEKIWLNVRALIDGTNNGGLISLYYNADADTLPDCMAALEQLGAHDVTHQVERVSALFPADALPSFEARNDVINSWDDKDPRIHDLLVEVDVALTPMLDELEQKLDNFVRRMGLAP